MLCILVFFTQGICRDWYRQNSRLPPAHRTRSADTCHASHLARPSTTHDASQGTEFEWKSEVDLRPALGNKTLPCNIRMYPKQDGRAIIPDLSGPVAVLDAANEVISIVKVSELLAAEQHKHPHDAIFLPNGDMVVATWAPGRISYWKLLPAGDEE